MLTLLKRIPFCSAERTAEYALIGAAVAIAVLATTFALGGILDNVYAGGLAADTAPPPAQVVPTGHRS